jgi:hypothetical protein
MEVFAGIKGEIGDTLSHAYVLAVSKLQNAGPVTRQEKEIIALRLLTLARQGVKRPELLSEAAIELLRRKRSRTKDISRQFPGPVGTGIRARR